MRHAIACAASAAVLAFAAPASAHDPRTGLLPAQPGLPPLPPPDEVASLQRQYQLQLDEQEQARREWLAECRRRQQRNGGSEGAAVGAAIGGVAGNRLAGRGNRTIGTVAGVAVGAAAGSAMDRADHRPRRRDWCATYLEDYQARQSRQQPWIAYPGAVALMPVMTPAISATRQDRDCRETVTYEYVDMPVRDRRIHRAPAPARPVRRAPDKRIKL